jgi:glycosyltransferase involved in cell wall biosynthesis
VTFTGLLILALAGIWRRPVVYDTLELFFDRPFDQMPGWIVALLNLLRPLEALLIRRTAAVVAVSEGQASVLAARYGVAAPLVLRNSVDLRRLGSRAADFPAWAGRTVGHSGNLAPGRHLPDLVAALPYLPDDVRLVLLGDGVLRAQLVERAESLGVAERLVIVPPVPIDSVAPTLAQADVAAVLTSSPHLNNQNALPTKFFEAVAAGLPMVTSSIAEVKRLVEAYDIGLSCDPDDPQDIAAKLALVLEPDALTRFRANAEGARDELNWEREQVRLVALYTKFLAQ